MMDLSETSKVAATRLPNMAPEKIKSKAWGTVLGLGYIAAGILIAIFLVPPLSVWCVYALIGYGSYCLRGDIVRNFAAFLPAVIRDVRAAIKGNS